MSNETSVGNATIGLSASVGLIATVNEYAIVISLSLTVLGIFIGILFHVLALKDRRKQMNFKKWESERVTHLEEQVRLISERKEERETE
jgi:hypothetical protein